VRRYEQVFAALPDQVRLARRSLAEELVGCPAADEVILCLSELASNCVVHSASRLPGGEFRLRAELSEGNYVRIELRDDGGPWKQREPDDCRPHGLDIVRDLALEYGVRGDARTGWITWATLSWNSRH
jgi:anti-sigma regulatory factor (Ser/Thr protein kinase)